MKKEYSNQEITVIWEPEKCIHSALCFRSLPKVFDPRRRPWIDITAAESALIVNQVKACPSGALSFKINDAPTTDLLTPTDDRDPVEITIIPNGPLRITQPMIIKKSDGTEELKQKASLCRCGHSENKPFCDGSHKKIGFIG